MATVTRCKEVTILLNFSKPIEVVKTSKFPKRETLYAIITK